MLQNPLDNPDWRLGIFKNWSMALILGLPALFAIISFGTYVWIHWRGKKNKRRINQLGRHEYHRPASFRRSVREGLRIETSSLDVMKILQEKIVCSQQSREQEDEDNDDTNDRDRSAAIFKIHPQSNITEEDIRLVYAAYLGDIPGVNEDDAGDKIVLFYRLASIFVSTGMSTIENEEYLHSCCEVLGLPPLSLLTLGLKEITAQFKIGPVVNISCSTADFYQLSFLSRAQQLAHTIINEGVNNAEEDVPGQASSTEGDAAESDKARITIPARVYLEVLDELEQTKDPYGWIIRLIAVYGVCTFAPLTIYGGNYANLATAAIISVPITAEVFLFNHYCPDSFGTWEVPLVSFTTGLLSPILWQATAARFDQEQCNANATIGVLLIWFPGSTLVYGAHEVIFGSYYNGSARLVKGILSALVIALFYTFGWQYFGVNWWIHFWNNDIDEYIVMEVNETLVDTYLESPGTVASLPPSRNCPDGNTLPWWMGSVVFTVPFNLSSMIIFGIRRQDLLGAFLVAQATYCGRSSSAIFN